MRVVFMGTPAFAVASLNEIHTNSNHQVVGVVTVPDKPSGRGQKINISDVKKYALDNNLPLLQPEKLKDESFLNDLKKLNADIFVVVAFRMLPKVVWSMPKNGTFNLHGSLLPQYRGAAPINWAIINGEKKTGVTTFLIDEEIDTGLMIDKTEIEINENDTTGIVHDKLMEIGAKLVVKTLDKIELGNFDTLPQPNDIILNHAPKIFKENCKIDWNLSIQKIHNLIRGLSPYPSAWTTYGYDNNFKSLKITSGKISTIEKQGELFELVRTKNNLYISLADGMYEILELQPEGKRKMDAKDFINGHLNYKKLYVL